MTSTAILYYLCKSEDVHIGFFGNADQCADWYLTYGGAEYRVYPKLKKRYNRQNELTAEDVHLDEGNGPVWYVAFKSANDYLFREAPFTVVGKNQSGAYHALLRHVVESKLLNVVESDDDFYMVSAEKALPSLIRCAEMRELYNHAGQSETGKDDEVVKWFCNAEHSKEALLEMVDILSSRLRLPLTATQAIQIKKQITDAVVDQDMSSQTKATYSPIPVFCQHSIDTVERCIDMNRDAKEYRLADLRSTTGWRTLMDPNVRDRLSMLPAEVAIQAGNLAEFIAITSHPEFRLESLGHTELYLLVGLRAAIGPYPEAEMRSAVTAVASALRNRARRGAASL